MTHLPFFHSTIWVLAGRCSIMGAGCGLWILEKEGIMKKMVLGTSTLEVSRIALGCMRLSEDRAQAMATLHAALDQGINFFDHADIYGRGQREATFSHIWQEAPRLRQEILLQSKCGIRFAGDPDERSPARYDFSAEHILRSVEGSLARLKTDYLDVLLLHRPDALVEPEEVARAFDELHRSGKVRWFGVSNHTWGQIQLLQTCVDQPLVANQIELNPFNRLSQMPLVEATRRHDITVVGYRPFANGAKFDHPVAAEIASRHGKTVAQVYLRWHVDHGTAAVPGWAPRRLMEENLDVFDFALSDAELAALDALDEDLKSAAIPPEAEF